MAALFNNNSSVVVSKDKNKSEKLCSKYKCNPSYKLLLLTVFSTGHVSVVRKKWEEWLLVVFFFHSQSCFCLALDLVLNLNINLKYCSLATRSNSKSWNHDVFEGLWGKVCVLVWLRGEKKSEMEWQRLPLTTWISSLMLTGPDIYNMAFHCPPPSSKELSKKHTHLLTIHDFLYRWFLRK